MHRSEPPTQAIRKAAALQWRLGNQRIDLVTDDGSGGLSVVLRPRRHRVARDYSDVRTVETVYRRVPETAPAREVYCVYSGAAHTLADVLNRLAVGAGYRIKINNTFVRANEAKRLLRSNGKLVRRRGFLPVIPLEATLRWMCGARPDA